MYNVEEQCFLSAWHKSPISWYLARHVPDKCPTCGCLRRLPSVDIKGKGCMRTWWFPFGSDVDILSIKAGLIQDLANLANQENGEYSR